MNRRRSLNFDRLDKLVLMSTVVPSNVYHPYVMPTTLVSGSNYPTGYQAPANYNPNLREFLAPPH